MPTFPTISDASLTPFRALKIQLEQDPELFSHPDCPYSLEVRKILSEMLGVGQKEEYSDDDLVRQTVELYEVAKDATKLQVADPKDRVAVAKTASDLLGKLIGYRQVAMNIRSMSQFQKSVLEVLEGILEPHQRSEFVEKLGKYVDVR